MDTQKRTKLLSTQMLWLFLLTITFQLGCDSFNPPPCTSTTNPTDEQIKYCRAVMYINPDVEITPLGHCHDIGFQDDVIHFKFKVIAKDTSSIFQPKFVSPDEMVQREPMTPPRYGLVDQWWDAADHLLYGGDFTVPDPKTQGNRGLNIGVVENSDGSFTVYSSWHET